MKTTIFTTLGACCACLFPAYANAQQGDKGKSQIAPIPADQIPPSPYLNKTEAMKTFVLENGFVMENIAEENVHQPVCLSFDADGRAWVVEMTQYMVDPDAKHENDPTGRIKVLEDTDGDGSLDKTTIFLDNLILPRACAVTSGGLLFAHKDQLYFIKRRGLKPVGKAELIDKDYAVGGNAEHKANGLLYARDNWYYNAKSNARYRRIKGKWVKQNTTFRGQWGMSQDDAGRLFYNSNSNLLSGDHSRPNLYSQHPSYKPKQRIGRSLGRNNVYPIRMNPGVNRAYTGILTADGKLKTCTSAAGMTIYRGQQFPKEYYGTGFISAAAANLVKAMKISYDENNQPRGTFVKGKEFLASTDEWFRPVNIYTAPDGTLWVIDMYMGMIQHKTYMTTYLRNQYLSRGLDKPEPNNGRIYRIRYAKNDVGEVPKLRSSSLKELSDHLNHANGTVRDTAQRLLVETITTDPKSRLFWTRHPLPKSDKPMQQLHTLWVYESINRVPAELILSCLKSSNTDVVNSALELAHLADKSVEKALLSFVHQPKTLRSYIFALGKQGSEKTHEIANKLVKNSQLETLYISGLGNKVETLLHFKTSPNLKKSFGKAMKGSKAEGKALKVPKGQKKRYEHGKKLYLGPAACAGCHGVKGEGQGDIFPPLAKSEWVKDPEVFAKVMLHGLEGPIKVNGVAYKGDQAMPAYKDRADLSDEDLASLMTYIRYMKGNKGGAVTAAQVKKVRAATKDRKKSYTAKDLK